MLPHEIVMQLRENFVLQNTIHWIKSIAIADRQGGTRNPRPFQTDQLETISERLPRIHFSFHARRQDRHRPARARRALSGQEQYCALVAHARERPALPRQHLVHSLRNDSAPRKRAAASGHISRSRSPRIASSSTAFRAATMLDPFLGIGNSAVAAKRCGVKNSSDSRSIGPISAK